jgi:hypothetical protein
MKRDAAGDGPTGAVEKTNAVQDESTKTDPNLAKWNALREIAEKMYSMF